MFPIPGGDTLWLGLPAASNRQEISRKNYTSIVRDTIDISMPTELRVERRPSCCRSPSLFLESVLDGGFPLPRGTRPSSFGVRSCVPSDKHIWDMVLTDAAVIISIRGCTLGAGTQRAHVPPQASPFGWTSLFFCLRTQVGRSRASSRRRCRRQGWGDPPLPFLTVTHMALTPPTHTRKALICSSGTEDSPVGCEGWRPMCGPNCQPPT